MGDAIGYIKLNIQDFKNKYEQVHNDTEQLDKMADSMGTVFDKAGKIMAAAFASVSTAAAMALKSVINVGSSFQSSMSQVAATMGMSANEIANNSEEYKKLSEAAKEMGATTRFSATEAADALNYLALAGYSVDESISVLPEILNVAAAGGMDLAKASDMVTDAMSALGLPLEQTTSFVDKLAKTAQKSNTSVSQLGDAILQIGGTAKSLAGGVDELNTALGILANNGIKASEGGIALRQVILNLTAPTEKAADFMKSIGLSAYDAAGNMKPLNQVFKELNDILSQYNTQQEKDNVLTQIFDARQLKSARALLAGYGDAWDELYENIQNADGAASRMAETMQENLSGAITIAKSALEGVQVTAYESLENGLTKSVKTATTSIDQLNKTLQTPEMQAALEKIGNMLGDVLSKFAEFTANKAIPKAVEWFSKLDETANTLKAVLTGLAIVFPVVSAEILLCNKSVQLYIAQMIAAKTSTLGFQVALAALTNPITLVVVAIAALTAAYVKYRSDVKSAIKAVQEQETEFSRAADAARDSANALDEYRQKSEEIAKAKNDEIKELQNATDALKQYATGEKLSADELANAQTIIEKLNELYPENTAYILDGQVVGYEELAKSVENYTNKLYYAQLLEANKEQYFSSRQVVEETTAALEGQAEAVVKAQEEYVKLRDARAEFAKTATLTDEELLEQARASGQAVGKYLEIQEAAAKANYENIAEAWDMNRLTLGQAERDLKEAEDKMLKLRVQAGEKVEGIYANQAEAVEDQTRKMFEKQEKQWQEKHKDEIEEQEKAAQARADAYNKMWDDLAQLDKDWQLRIIDNEDEYQKRRKELLEQGAEIGVNDDKWIKEYNKSLVYQEKTIKEAEDEKTKIEKAAADERQKARKEEIDNQIKDLEARVETDVNYTKQMMIKDKEAIIEGLDKNSDLYKEYSKEILNDKRQLAIDLAKENQKIAEDEFNTWQDNYNDLVSEATDAYNQIKTNQDNVMKSLTSNIKLYDTESKKVWDKQKKAYKTEDSIKVNAKAMEEQATATEEYIKALENLQGKIPDSLMAEIYAMDREEGEKYVAELNKMSDAELKTYSEAYQKQYDIAKEFSEKMYAEQLQSFKQNYTDKFENLFKEVPDNMNLVGQDSIDGFIKGVENKTKNAEGAMKELADDILAKTKEALDIHSPSGKFEDIGENMVLGIPKGVKNKEQEVLDSFKNLGENSGNNFVTGFRKIWSVFLDSLKTDVNSLSLLNDVSTSFNKPVISEYGNQNNVQKYPQYIQYQESSYRGDTLSKQDIVSAIKEAMPDGDVVLQIDGKQFALIARKELNKIASESGNLNIKI